ncbi:MAG: hypothetical protein N2Z73_04010, partial [Endomicrobia bacterium]|nr:hypothetical protein [Endomicrobiia bacterium]
MLPTIRKKITGFLLSEDGQISKNVLTTLGAIVCVAGASIAASQHSSTSITYQQRQIIGQHS